MNRFIMGAYVGVLSLAASQCATTQTVSAKPTAKKTPAKKKATKKAESATAAKPGGVRWKYELGNELYITGDMARDRIIKSRWRGKNHDLPRQLTHTGADRYSDQKTGFDLVVIPAKTILFGRNEGHRLADECQTAEVAAGAPAPAQASALRAPVGLPLMTPGSPAPAPAPAPGTAQLAQQ